MSPEDLQELTELIGLDITTDVLDRWIAQTTRRDLDALRRQLDSVARTIPDALSAGFDVARFTPKSLTFLARRTQILRYASDCATLHIHRDDARTSLALAAAIDGAAVRVQLDPDSSSELMLFEGSNLVVTRDPSGVWPAIEFDGSNGTATVDGQTVDATYGPDRVVLGELDRPYAVSLPYDGDFCTMFVETCGAGKGETKRRLIVDRATVTDELEMLGCVKSALKNAWPGAWQMVRETVMYVNWSDVAASGTDTREPRGAIRLHPRADLVNIEERIAVSAASLYHEAKHLQFFDTVHPHAAPGTRESESAFARLGSATPRVPCAWRGMPSSRSMPEHLVALQAFVPGMIVGIDLLCASPRLTDWTRDYIELNMRAINGGVGVLILGQRHLDTPGRTLSDVIRRDYALHLIPKFDELVAQPKLRAVEAG